MSARDRWFGHKAPFLPAPRSLLSSGDQRTGWQSPISGRTCPAKGERLVGKITAPEQPAVSSGVLLTAHTDLSEVEADWRALETCADRTVFQSFDWMAKWQAHIGSLKNTTPAVIVGRTDRGEPLFIIPLMVENRRLARCLTWLGSDLCDYNAPLLAPGFTASQESADFAALWGQIITLLRAEPGMDFDLVDLSKMPCTVGSQPNPFLRLAARPHASDAHIATLADDWDSFYTAKRSASTRKAQRKQIKRLSRHGEIRFVDADDRGARAATLDTLVDQKQRALARMGVDDIFSRAGYREFFHDIATDPAFDGVIHLSRLDVGSTTVATSLGMRHGDRYYFVLSSYHDGPLARFGPGRAHLLEVLRYATTHGFTQFDFTVGNEPYKGDWSDITVRLYDHISAWSVRGMMIKPILLGFRATKRFIKNNPLAWRAYAGVRSYAAPLARLRGGGRDKSPWAKEPGHDT